jgi:hypothetical protein
MHTHCVRRSCLVLATWLLAAVQVPAQEPAQESVTKAIKEHVQTVPSELHR